LKHIFFVDFENVHFLGLKGVSLLSKEDRLIIFYSETNTESIAIIRELRNDFEYIKIVKSSQNALDFQLSSYLGYIINETISDETINETQFVIVSKDNGFDCVTGFWKKNSFEKDMKTKHNIKRAVNIESVLMPAEKETEDKKEPLMPQQQEIDEIIKRFGDLKEFHNFLVNTFKENGLKLYKENKARFKEIHNL
jgi:hypothetical protein